LTPSVISLKTSVFKDTEFLKYFSYENSTTVFTDFRQIGCGIFGAVYYAQNRITSEVVVIKELKVDTKRKKSEEEWSDIVKEIKLPSYLAHKNCVLPKGCFMKEQTSWLIMEYFIGSLADVLEVHKKPLREDEIAFIVQEVLTDLDSLHSEKRIHRDIKAANILLTDSIASFVSPVNSFIAPLRITCIEMAEFEPPYFSATDPMAALYQIASNDALRLMGGNWSDEFQDFLRFVLPNAMRHPFLASVFGFSHILPELIQRSKAAVAVQENQISQKWKNFSIKVILVALHPRSFSRFSTTSPNDSIMVTETSRIASVEISFPADTSSSVGHFATLKTTQIIRDLSLEPGVSNSLAAVTFGFTQQSYGRGMVTWRDQMNELERLRNQYNKHLKQEESLKSRLNQEIHAAKIEKERKRAISE
ncbi:unnamed protein product, partial [Schistosoma margrebowiei]